LPPRTDYKAELWIIPLQGFEVSRRTQPRLGRQFIPAVVQHDESMTTRFPAPWRIVEIPHGFAVEDATGKQIGVFYGRASVTAGHTGIMTMDEARQMALDFAKLPELLKRDGNAG
jgi:hypothetical protein